VCGWRDDAGFVRKVEALALRSLPKRAADFWRPNVCANFLQEFLSFLHESLRAVDNPRRVGLGHKFIYSFLIKFSNKKLYLF
jgi:hypothetical protein